MIKYTSYKNLRNLLRQLLSCKISYKIQLKNLKYLPPQSLTCEVYRKQENEVVKDLLPQLRRTRKINDKMQQRVEKLFSRSHFCAKSTIKCIKTKYITSSATVSHVRSLRSNVRKASEISYSLYPLYSYL